MMVRQALTDYLGGRGKMQPQQPPGGAIPWSQILQRPRPAFGGILEGIQPTPPAGLPGAAPGNLNVAALLEQYLRGMR